LCDEWDQKTKSRFELGAGDFAQKQLFQNTFILTLALELLNICAPPTTMCMLQTERGRGITKGSKNKKKIKKVPSKLLQKGA
jgi:hypothetical protein